MSETCEKYQEQSINSASSIKTKFFQKVFEQLDEPI